MVLFEEIGAVENLVAVENGDVLVATWIVSPLLENCWYTVRTDQGFTQTNNTSQVLDYELKSCAEFNVEVTPYNPNSLTQGVARSTSYNMC